MGKLVASLLPWAAFAFGNLLCCGLILAATQVSWRLGFSLTVAYFLVSMGLALNMEKERWHDGIRSLLWVLVCGQLGILGTWLSFATIPWEMVLEVGGAVPIGSGHAVYGPHLYFSSGTPERILMRADSQSFGSVPPGVIDAHSFMEHNGSLFFFGRPNASAGECLWRITGHGDATLIRQFQPGFDLRHLNASGTSEMDTALTFQVYGRCGALRSRSFFRSNGTLEGTEAGGFVDLAHLCLQLAAGLELRPPTGRLMGMLILGILPQTGLATYLLFRRKVPGAFLNVFLGAYAVAFIIWMLTTDKVADVLFFAQVSTMTYATLSCLAVAVNQVLTRPRSATATELGSWAAAVSAVAFFGAVHLVLDFPFSNSWLNWLLYALLQLPQIAFALLMRRMTPMALFIIGWLIILHKAVAEIDGRVGQGWPAELGKALQLGAFYILGALVCLILLGYKDNKSTLEELVGKRFECSPEEAWQDGDEFKPSEPMSEPEEDKQESWLLLQQLPWLQLLQLQQHFGAGRRHASKEDEEDC